MSHSSAQQFLVLLSYSAFRQTLPLVHFAMLCIPLLATQLSCPISLQCNIVRLNTFSDIHISFQAQVYLIIYQPFCGLLIRRRQTLGLVEFSHKMQKEITNVAGLSRIMMLVDEHGIL